jgi:hypothetical protein
VICSLPVRGGAHPRPMGFSRTGKANGAPGHPGGVDGEQMAQTQTHVPPQNLEAEASVLGAMMVSEGAIAPVILDIRLRDEDFYRERHRIVFRAVKALYERSEPVDALTVTEHLTQQGELAEAGGKDAVSEFASTVPAPGNARHYAQIVKQNSLLRRLLEASQRIEKSAQHRLMHNYIRAVPILPSGSNRSCQLGHTFHTPPYSDIPHL